MTQSQFEHRAQVRHLWELVNRSAYSRPADAEKLLVALGAQTVSKGENLPSPDAEPDPAEAIL